MSEEEVKDFAVKNCGKRFISAKEVLYSKVDEETFFRKIVESFYTFLTMPGKV